MTERQRDKNEMVSKTFRVPPDLWDQAKQSFDNVSQELRELLRGAIAEAEYSSDFKRRVHDLESHLDKVETEVEVVRAELEDVKSMADEAEEAELDRGLDVIRRKATSDEWQGPEDIRDYWPRNTGLSRQELWDQATD